MTSENEKTVANALLSWSKVPNTAYSKPSPIQTQPRTSTGTKKIWNQTPQTWLTPFTLGSPNPRGIGHSSMRKSRRRGSKSRPNLRLQRSRRTRK